MVAQAYSSQDIYKDFLYSLLVEHSWIVEILRVVDSFSPDNQS